MASAMVETNMLDEVVKSATVVRDKVRALITIRTGLVIIKREQVGEVMGFIKDCKKLSVRLTGKMKEKIDEMKERAANNVAEDVDDDLPGDN